MPKRKTIIWAAVGAVALVGIVYFAFLRKPKTQYNTFEVKRGELKQTVSATGTLKSNDTISLNFETSGRVREVDVKVGQTIAKGDILAVLNEDNLQLSVDRAKADLDKARAEAGASGDTIHTDEVAVSNAEDALRDTKRLNDAKIDAADQTADDAKSKLDDAQAYYDQEKSDHGSGSSEAKLAKLTLDTAEASYNDAKKAQDVADQTADLAETEAENALNSAKAELAASESRYAVAADNANVAAFQATYETALANLDKATLRAPSAGVIKEVNFKVGEVYGGTISNINTSGDFAKMISFGFVLEAKIPESDVAKIKIGQKAEVSFDAFEAGEKFEATAVSIDPSATIVQDVVDYVVKFVMENDDSRFKDGMSSDLDILVADKQNVLMIPERAVKDSGGKSIVQILESGKPVDQEIQTGMKGDEGMIEVTSGLKEGEMVITSQK